MRYYITANALASGIKFIDDGEVYERKYVTSKREWPSLFAQLGTHAFADLDDAKKNVQEQIEKELARMARQKPRLERFLREGVSLLPAKAPERMPVPEPSSGQGLV